ncbi:MAG: hypothetical protein N2422_04700 [Rhodobacteraceae bacterium]|nr:hypothetical protein [Paracoccaceae bacterium]
MTRTVICHYHIFKNAGTAFDHVLSASFGNRHIAFDGPFPFFTIDQEQLDRIITRKREAVAFSSHQIHLPAPEGVGYRVLPALFLRDPLLRVASIWRFKRLADDGTATAAAARRMGLADWVRHSLDDPDEVVHVSNAQTRHLGAAPRCRPALVRRPWGIEYDLDRALANLRSVVLLGRTEHFDDDLARIAAKAAGHGLSLVRPADLRRNATDDRRLSPEERRAELTRMLGEALAGRLAEANAQDSALCAAAAALLSAGDAGRDAAMGDPARARPCDAAEEGPGTARNGRQGAAPEGGEAPGRNGRHSAGPEGAGPGTGRGGGSGTKPDAGPGDGRGTGPRGETCGAHVGAPDRAHAGAPGAAPGGAHGGAPGAATDGATGGATGAATAPRPGAAADDGRAAA